MDNLTHSLVGAVLAQAGLKKKTGLALPALVIGANIPDIDAACFFWIEGTEHLAIRRGITHGPPALVLLPLVLAGLLWWFDRWQAKRGKRPEGRLPVHFGWLYGLSLLGCLTHPAMDWLNVYGVRWLEPFSSEWFYGDTLFIIDVWLWALLIGSVWWSARKEKRSGEWKQPARIGIAVGLAYIGVNWAISQQAQNEAVSEFLDVPAIASPLPILFWEREIIWHAPDAEPEIARPMWGKWSVFGGLDPNGRSSPTVVFIEQAGENLPAAEDLSRTNGQVGAFLFWSRTPFVECSSDGSVILYDARFYDPRARDRFSVALPDVECEPLATPSP